MASGRYGLASMQEHFPRIEELPDVVMRDATGRDEESGDVEHDKTGTREDQAGLGSGMIIANKC